MIYQFEDYSLDIDRQELRRGSELVDVEPQVLDLLQYLIRNRERVVSKDDLIEHVWHGRIVSESTLTSRITTARHAIGDSGDHQRLIRTIPRKGIRFVGEVRGGQDTNTGNDATDIERPDFSATVRRLPDKPAIAVLPFTNMSGDPEQEYFADGMVDELITGLSRIKWLLVVSRNSSLSYKNKPVTVAEVAQALGVRYVLEGSVRKSGNRVRITAQLIDAGTFTNLWADKYDRLLEDIFALQDEITMCVIGAIEPNLRKAEIDRVKRQRPSNLDAYDFLLRSLPFVFTRMPKEAAMAIPLLERALEIEPDYSAAHAFLSWCLHARFARGEQREEDRIAAIHHAHAAISCGSDDATTLSVAAFVIALDEHETSTALSLFDRALELSSSNNFALSCSAFVLAFMGKSEIAIERAQLALRLSPFDSSNFRSYLALAVAHFHAKRYHDAKNAARSSVDALPNGSFNRAILAAALIRLGQVDDARAAAQSAMELQPFFSIRGSATVFELEPAVFRPLADAWREVGLPE